jgi:hypothetical protein
VVIVSGKRAPRGNPGEGAVPAESDLYPIHWSDTESDLFSIHLSDTESPQPPSTPDHASGSRPGIGMPSSPSSGSKSPLWSTAGGTEVPLDTEGAFKPGTTIGNQPPASSGKTKSVSWGHTTKVHIYDKDPFENPLPLPPGRNGYLAKVAAQQSPSPNIEHASSSSYFDPPKPQSKGFVSNFKTFFAKLGKLNLRPNFKTLSGKLGKLKFRPRFQSQRMVDAGASVSASFLPPQQIF